MNKSKLKEGYYYEEKPWYDTLPDTIASPEPFTTVIFEKDMTHDEILKEYNIVPYNSYMDAAIICLSIIPDLKNDYKGRIIYFKENDVLYRFYAWRFDSGELNVNIFEVDRGDGGSASYGACFSDDLTLERAIGICIMNGYNVTKNS